MGRIHAFEISDQTWCPKAVRDGVTDYLQFLIHLTGQYDLITPLFREALERTRSKRIIDLCSGGGGPWIRLCEAMETGELPHLEVCLTDRFPNIEAFQRVSQATHGQLTFHPESVDVMALPEELSGFRTLFTSFHHFRPSEARQILRDAIEKKQPIAIFEYTRRELIPLFVICLGPLTAPFLVPFIRPFRWSRLFWTYLIPLVLLVLLFDGIVSCLRTYSPPELTELVSDLADAEYVWQIGEKRTPGSPFPITYLIGHPKTLA